MVERAIDPAYLFEQYGTEERLRIRIEAHQRYSERTDDYFEWILDRLQPRPGDLPRSRLTAPARLTVKLPDEGQRDARTQRPRAVAD
jgi:hypothetical protein